MCISEKVDQFLSRPDSDETVYDRVFVIVNRPECYKIKYEYIYAHFGSLPIKRLIRMDQLCCKRDDDVVACSTPDDSHDRACVLRQYYITVMSLAMAQL